MSERLPESPLASRVLEVCVRELGTVKIAERLGVTPVLLEMWRTGQAVMTRQTFEKLVDVLVELKPGWEDWDRE